jgi:hypothetical protein
VWNASKDHHLLGLYNPAELAMYGKFLPTVVTNSIRSNDSSSCFWHSLHGVQYSYDYGLMYKKIETEVDFAAPFRLSQQHDLFYFNSKLIELFTRGKEAAGLAQVYSDWLSECIHQRQKETKWATALDTERS